MNVPVDDHHPLRPSGEGALSGASDVIEVARAHCGVPLSVVAGWPQLDESAIRPAVHDCIDRDHCPPGGKSRGPIRFAPHRCEIGVPRSLPKGRGSQVLDIRRSVNRKEDLVGYGFGIQPDNPLLEHAGAFGEFVSELREERV